MNYRIFFQDCLGGTQYAKGWWICESTNFCCDEEEVEIVEIPDDEKRVLIGQVFVSNLSEKEILDKLLEVAQSVWPNAKKVTVATDGFGYEVVIG